MQYVEIALNRGPLLPTRVLMLGVGPAYGMQLQNRLETDAYVA